MVVNLINLALQEGVGRPKWTEHSPWERGLELGINSCLQSIKVEETGTSFLAEVKVLHASSFPSLGFSILLVAVLCIMDVFNV